MKLTLRDYQLEGVEKLRDSIKNGAKRPVFCLPTGGGKTVCFSYLAHAAQQKSKLVGVVCHRRTLIKQAKSTMTEYGVNPHMVSYGMTQTYVRSPHKIPRMDLCIIDECHIGNFRRFVEIMEETQPNCLIIGFTATPISASKKNPLNLVFDKVVAPIGIGDLIKKGSLSKPIYHVWELDESNLKKDTKGEFTEASQSKVFHLDDLREAFRRRHGKTIIFCSSIKQTEEAYNTLTKENPNVPIFQVHSKMSDAQSEITTDTFKAVDNAVMINCGILTAGFDDPQIRTVVLYRATTSLSLYLQMIGRGSRVIEGEKDWFYVFDLGNNRKRLMPWEAPRDWEALFNLQGKTLKEKEAAMKKCVSCEAVIYASSRVCPYCNATQPEKQKIAPKATGIKVIESYSDLPEHLKKDFSAMTLKELIERAEYGSPGLGRPYKNTWVIAQLRDRPNYPALVKEYAKIKGYKPGWVVRQLTK